MTKPEVVIGCATRNRRETMRYGLMTLSAVALLAAAAGFTGASWRKAHFDLPRLASNQSTGVVSAPSDVAELEGLRQEVRALALKVALLEAASRQAAGTQVKATDVQPSQGEPLSEAELQSARLQELDVALEDQGRDTRTVRAAESAMRTELSVALGDQAQLVNLKCGAAVCRATFEEDTTHQSVDISKLIGTVPSLRSEAMFNYEREGTLKRTTVYASRAGQPLPVRGEATDSPPPPPPPLLGVDG